MGEGMLACESIQQQPQKQDALQAGTMLSNKDVVCVVSLHLMNLKQSLATFQTFPPSAVNKKFCEKSSALCPSNLTNPSTTTSTVV